MARKNTSKKIKPESINRAEVVRRNDNVPNITVGLYEHDEAIKYYIDNTIKPHVIDSNNDSIKVPVIYGNPEKWNSVQKSSFYRDKESKIQIPLIMYRRTSIENDRSISRNLDANNPHIHQYIENSYTRVNKYDAIDRLIGRKPVQELHRIVVPNYVTLTYEFIIWTDFIGQMNKVIEAINYAEGSHWGDPSRFIFSTTIDSFDNIVEVTQDNDRAVRTSFTLRIKGYIIPENIQKAATEQSQKVFTRAVVQFTENIDGTIIPTNKPSLIQGIGGGGDSIPQTSTISVNNITYNIIDSGDSENIPIINSVATEIGDVNAGINVTIPDVEYQIVNQSGSVIASGSWPAQTNQDIYVTNYLNLSTVYINGTPYIVSQSINSIDIPIYNSNITAIGTISGSAVSIGNMILDYPDNTTGSIVIIPGDTVAILPHWTINLTGTVASPFTVTSPPWDSSFVCVGESLTGGTITDITINGGATISTFVGSTIPASATIVVTFASSLTQIVLTF